MSANTRRFSKASQERRYINRTYTSPIDQHHQIGIHPLLSTEKEDQERRTEGMGMDPKFSYQTNHYRAREAIRRNVNEAIRLTPLDHIVFFTFTFEHIPDPHERRFAHARTCFQTANRGVLKEVFFSHLSVLDVHKSGLPHFHGIATTHLPVRLGFSEDAYDDYISKTKWGEFDASRRLSVHEIRKLRDAVSSNPELRKIWRLLDEALPAIGFGPIIGVFPIRKPPRHARFDGSEAQVDCEEEKMTSGVATYLTQAYCRSIPFINGTGIRTRSYASSKNFPSRITASKIVNPRWLDAKDTLASLFGIDSENGFAANLGQSWGLTVSDLVDALDASLEVSRGSVKWRGAREARWLAFAVKSLIAQENSFNVFDQFVPRLEALCSGYEPTLDEPRLVAFEPCWERSR